ncbi:class I SAM-dependent methyltransferase [Nocardia sp. NBC_00565]|uniref:class I SAM-dependent methyltransferase n=1 Tax=Nocardia sp. NBC_00565 TaxID=2975993 RepID=UPI003FA526B4
MDAPAATMTGATTLQVVILGAGLDTTAYRHGGTHARIFEVDHPDTQEWKRDRLARAEIAIPASLTFAPIVECSSCAWCGLRLVSALRFDDRSGDIAYGTWVLGLVRMNGQRSLMCCSSPAVGGDVRMARRAVGLGRCWSSQPTRLNVYWWGG